MKNLNIIFNLLFPFLFLVIFTTSSLSAAANSCPGDVIAATATSVTGTINTTNTDDYYQYSPGAGNLNISYTSGSKIYFYAGTGICVTANNIINQTSGATSDSGTKTLIATDIIYIHVDRRSNNTGYTINLDFTPANTPPNAVAAATPTSVTVGDNVDLDGRGSGDTDGTIASWSWTDGTSTWTGETTTISTTGWSIGNHTITLTVTDDDGATDTDTVEITVNAVGNTPPTAVAAATPTSVTVGDNVALDGSGSSDTDGTIQSWSWTDGTSTWTGETTTISTTGWSIGDHSITLTVTDDDGAIDTDTVVITVTPVSIPSASIANVSINEGDSGTSTLNFTVTLDVPAPAGGVSLDYATSDGTATTADSDYVESNDTLTIAAGATTGIISVTINGDTTVEPNETFSVTLSNEINATLGTAIATGTILDDDACTATTLLEAYNNGDTNTTTGSVTSNNGDYYAIYIDTNGTLEVNLTNMTNSKDLEYDFNQNCSLLFDTGTGTTSTLKGGANATAYISVSQGWYFISFQGVHANQATDYALTVTFFTPGSGGAGSYVNSNVGVNELGINYDTDKNITTKVVAKPFGMRASYLDENLLVTTYDGSFGNNKTVDMSVILSLVPDSCIPFSPNQVVGQILILDGDQYGETANDAMTIDYAAKIRRFAMTSFDFGNLFRHATGLNCAASSLQSSLCLVPACFNSEDNIKAVFPPAFYPRVLTCVNGDGGGAAPCDSNAYYGSCGGKKESVYISPSIYNHDLGCAACLADAIEGEPCSVDNFAIRPDKFDVNITTTTPLTIFKAGKEENLLFRAPDYINNGSTDYNETQNTSFYIDLNVSNSSACQIKNLTITPNVSFTDGIHQDNFRFNDIGDINMSIHETNGTEFAIIDNDDTPLEDRLIQEYNASFTVIPDHFNIDANLTDHNSDNNFTYLHDINFYDSDDNYSMAAVLTVDIHAMGKDNNITRNYMETCYAKDTNLTLGLGGTNITYPGSVPLTQFLYYNPVEDNGTADSGEGNYSLPAPIANTISITTLPIENTESTFPADAPDGNGTTHIEYKLNFDRTQNLVVNPFRMLLSDVNITETNTSDPVEGTIGSLSDQNATLYYARTKSSQPFYDDVIDNNVTTPILIDVYCNLGFTTCDSFGINTIEGQTNEYEWWLSWYHNESNGDGNITLKVGTITPRTGSGTASVDTDVTITSEGKDNNIDVRYLSGAKPMIVEIDLDETPSTDTNHWLIYNPNSALGTPTPFYKVRFIDQVGWAGHGDTGHVVDSNVSTKKNRRLGW